MSVVTEPGHPSCLLVRAWRIRNELVSIPSSVSCGEEREVMEMDVLVRGPVVRSGDKAYFLVVVKIQEEGRCLVRYRYPSL